MEKILAHIGEWLGYWLPPLAGGIVDWLNQINRGHKSWSFGGFVVHLASAAFFGWAVGSVACGLDYPDGVIAAAGGAGGFMGTRISDLIIFKIMEIDRRS